MTGGGDTKRRANLRRTLGALERAVAAALGEDGATEQAREYLEHHEFALALELLLCLAVRERLDPAALDGPAEDAAARMGLRDSEPLAEWRRYRAGGAA